MRRAWGRPGVGVPVLGITYSAIADVEKATRKLLFALSNIKKLAEMPKVIGRKNLAWQFFIDNSDFRDEDISFIDQTKYILEYIHPRLKLLKVRAGVLFKNAKRVEHGRGRRVEGYNDFVTGCHQVWLKHRRNKGWSKRNGRGAGPFVRFVCIAQELLPPSMRKSSEAAVGDAVVAAMTEGTS